MHVTVCVCVHVCVCVCACVIDRQTHISYSYCLIGDNGKLQYLRFCLLKCMLMWFL